MDFAYSDKVEGLRAKLQDFMDAHVQPADAQWKHETEDGRYPMALIDGLKAKAKAAGLWNLFIPALKPDEPGTRLTNLEYAPLAEIMGRLYWSSEVFNCNAPDTGNMEILHMFATPEQRQRWLLPLLNGEIRSCVGITEPGVASSDPTNLQTTITRDGDDYIVHGRKWWTTGALHPNVKFCIVMGLSDQRPDADPHRRHSMILVPMDSPGLTVMRNLPLLNHISLEGHTETDFDHVRVPASNMLGEEGPVSRWRRRGWGRAASTIACARSGNARSRWS